MSIDGIEHLFKVAHRIVGQLNLKGAQIKVVVEDRTDGLGLFDRKAALGTYAHVVGPHHLAELFR